MFIAYCLNSIGKDTFMFAFMKPSTLRVRSAFFDFLFNWGSVCQILLYLSVAFYRVLHGLC